MQHIIKGVKIMAMLIVGVGSFALLSWLSED